MIRITLSTGRLVQRLRARAERIAAGQIAARRRDASPRPNWRSAEALWPDLFGDTRDGK
jgi:hypothetical protein